MTTTHWEEEIYTTEIEESYASTQVNTGRGGANYRSERAARAGPVFHLAGRKGRANRGKQVRSPPWRQRGDTLRKT